MKSTTTLENLRDRLNKIQLCLSLQHDHEYGIRPNWFLAEFKSLTGYHLQEIQSFCNVLVIDPTKSGTSLRLLLEVRL